MAKKLSEKEVDINTKCIVQQSRKFLSRISDTIK